MMRFILPVTFYSALIYVLATFMFWLVNIKQFTGIKKRHSIKMSFLLEIRNYPTSNKSNRKYKENPNDK
ncbi:hypothetical protein COE55_06565 [Priestia megaterium]|nr:hypothetical protein COE55_06565 [Priestia megaterium]